MGELGQWEGAPEGQAGRVPSTPLPGGSLVAGGSTVVMAGVRGGMVHGKLQDGPIIRLTD